MRPAIRAAGAADLDAVTALDATCFGAAAWSPAAWAHEFSRIGVDRIVLIADEGAVVGYAVVLVPPAREDSVDLLRIAVDPLERRTGIGSQLLTSALAAVAGRAILLEVAASNEGARRLYVAQGFAQLSRRPRYYPGGEDAVIMQRPAAGETEEHE